MNAFLPFIVLVVVPAIVFFAVKYGFVYGSRNATNKH